LKLSVKIYFSVSSTGLRCYSFSFCFLHRWINNWD